VTADGEQNSRAHVPVVFAQAETKMAAANKKGLHADAL
jgi:hypothetical protein